ncbi:AAA family ATPase [Proteinivorax hydrogeniformans]|uniref:AAA family ATPase n=1 Tax=Proteinivorax hydrogeniformans TaxID=1826727 RepID=A0AAU8HNS2_9FIRM
MVIKELVVGTSIATVIVLSFYGINVFPVVLIASVLLFLIFRNEIVDKVESLNNKGKGHKNISQISFDEIGGQLSAKNELIEALDFIVDREKVKKLGIRPLKGIILAGPPGTGKTLLAKAAAKYTGSAFLSASGSEFVEMYAGVGAKRIRKLFKDAVTKAKKENKNSTLIFIDEIDVLGVKRGSNSSHMEYDQTLNELLVQMDGVKVSDEVQVLIMAATNRVDMLDDALLRPGRFDRVVNIPLPSKTGREEILKIHCKNKPLAKEVNIVEIAEQTFGFSGAHLENIANEAAIMAMRDGSAVILQKHFTTAIEKVIMGEKVDRVPSKDELFRVAIHEVGHGFISEYYEEKSVASITIAPRGQAMGYMRQTSKEQYIQTKKNILNKVAMTVGGAMAEQAFFGEFSTGATNDFKQAISQCKQLIDSGLSHLGTTNCEMVDSNMLQKEISNLIEEVKQETLNVIENNKELISEIADFVIQNETITGEQLREKIAASNDSTALC